MSHCFKYCCCTTICCLHFTVPVRTELLLVQFIASSHCFTQPPAVCIQVFHIGLEFYSPMPQTIVIERLFAGSDGYQPWQYYAENCTSSFGLENNGELTAEDTVNCIQLGA